MKKIIVDSIQNASSSSSISFLPSTASDKPAYINSSNNRYENAPTPTEVDYLHGPENTSAITQVTIPLYDGSNPIKHRKLRVLYHLDHAIDDAHAGSPHKAFDFIPYNSSNVAIQSLTQNTSQHVNYYDNWSADSVGSSSSTAMRLHLGPHVESTDHALANYLELNILFEPHASHYQFVLYGSVITQRSNMSSYMGCGSTYTRCQISSAPATLRFNTSVGSSSSDNPKAFKVIDLYEDS